MPACCSHRSSQTSQANSALVLNWLRLSCGLFRGLKKRQPLIRLSRLGWLIPRFPGLLLTINVNMVSNSCLWESSCHCVGRFERQYARLLLRCDIYIDIGLMLTSHSFISAMSPSDQGQLSLLSSNVAI